MKSKSVNSASNHLPLTLMALLILLLSLVTPGFTFAAVDDLLEDAYEDLRYTAETVVEQGEVVKDESVKLLIVKTVKSAKNFAGAPNLRRPENGGSFSMDLTTHHSISGALKESIKPQPLGSSITGSIKATTHPLTLASHFAAPLAVEGYRQITEDKKLNGKKLAEAVEPEKILGATAGVIIADVAGAGAQSALGAVGGPGGQIAGVLVRPLITWSGYYLGRNFGASVKEGKPSVESAVADTLREVNPVKFVSTVASTTAGGIVGQALIPVPVVGYVIGSAIGGVAGSALGNIAGKHGPLAGTNKALIAWQHKKADEIEHKKPEERLIPVDVDTHGEIVTTPTYLYGSEEKWAPSRQLIAQVVPR